MQLPLATARRAGHHSRSTPRTPAGVRPLWAPWAPPQRDARWKPQGVALLATGGAPRAGRHGHRLSAPPLVTVVAAATRRRLDTAQGAARVAAGRAPGWAPWAPFAGRRLLGTVAG
ncbi:hypothetical protein GCM10029964_020500 [Kibdelosporangium lantanae]